MMPPKTILIGLLSCLILAGCDKDYQDWKPVTDFTVKPDSGVTTHIFGFEAKVINTPKGLEAFFVRWDWNGDSVWDTPFSVTTSASHRFYKPDNHSVLAEILTQDGQRVTLSRTIRVKQGFSPPLPKFIVDPPEGNFLTHFTLDASLTRDDEDSASTLRYRWDWEDDGIWDTEVLTNPVIRHLFKVPRIYNIRLQVTDPTFRHADVVVPVSVNRRDTLIRIDFTWISKNNTVKDTFLFDASATHHETDSGRIFSYQWDIRNEVMYGPWESPRFDHVFWSKGEQTVTLTVVDQFGLQNSLSKDLYVYDENKPPQPGINLSTPFGNITTQFYIDAWASRDDRTPPSEMLIRWDFEGDGTWDTDWSYDKFLFHQYTTPGDYKLTLQARDVGGEMGKTSRLIKVSEHPNQTGYIIDKRNGKYYGTVKIGEQWWMSDNLDYRTNPKMDIPLLQQCWQSSEDGCDRYGSLYQGIRSIYFTRAGKQICPDGWRIPTRDDWEVLQKKVPATGGKESMEVGGSLGFNAQLFGYGNLEWFVDEATGDSIPIFNFYRMKMEVRYLSLTYRPHLEHSQSQFYAGLTWNYDGVDFRWGDMDGYYYLRCIKK